MSLYDDDLLETNKDGSTNGLLILIITINYLYFFSA